MAYICLSVQATPLHTPYTLYMSHLTQYSLGSYLIIQDLHSIDLEDFKYGGTNITAFRIVDPNNHEVINVVRNWVLGEKRFPS